MKVLNVIKSSDNTKKYYFGLSDSDQFHVEACLLHLKRYGYIICVSSQIGCMQKFVFCAAGNSRFVRNLNSEEIQDQVRLIIEDNPILVSEGFQVTYMGSGEPLSNFESVFKSIDAMRTYYPTLHKVNISTTCPTTSITCFKTIDWSKYKHFLHFQYSLHFTHDNERYKFLYPQLLKITVAIDYLNSISEIVCDKYKINYILFDELNDKKENIAELKAIMDTTQNAVLKISTMSVVLSSSLTPSKNFEQFVSAAQESIEAVEVFSSDGTDVNAGCGQFYNDSIL